MRLSSPPGLVPATIIWSVVHWEEPYPHADTEYNAYVRPLRDCHSP